MSNNPPWPRVTIEEVPDNDLDAGGLPRHPWVKDYPEPTRNRTRPSYTSKYHLLKKIDDLPKGHAKWEVEIFEAEGDEVDEDGKPKIEVVELWKRDVVDCVRELIGNPLFRDAIRYAPEREYADNEGNTRIYSNMWGADWWWGTKLPPGATIAPLIVASDKTTLSHMSGDKTAWPVYLTLGNIDKNVRRRPSSHATLLLGYLPAMKLECFSEKRRSLEGYRLFHRCMRSLLKPLILAGREGVLMTCADGCQRRVYPILAAYVADHPEQCLVSGCSESSCPKCTVEPKRRGEASYRPYKDPDRVLAILKQAASGEVKHSELESKGLRAIEPFWDSLPHSNIFTALTPDIFHQLHKGLFKDHLVSWVTKSIENGTDEIDQRYMAMARHPELHHFKKGISLVCQWTGTEYKNMEKVFLGAVLDFIYYTHFETHTDLSLDALHQAWTDFHKHKAIFVKLGICKDFNFPKAHSTEHYERAIRELGTADGYSTEHPERLHIDYAKLAYGASNKKSTYLKQMTGWLDWQETIHRFSSYLAWYDANKLQHNKRSLGSGGAAGVSQETFIGSEDTDKEDEERLQEEHYGAGAGMSRTTAEEDAHPKDDCLDEVAFVKGYRIAKEPAYPNLTISEVVQEFGATDLLQCITEYVAKVSVGSPRRLEAAAAPLHGHSRISVYKQFKVSSDGRVHIDIIHATPPRHSTGPHQLSTIPANVSTVLAQTRTLASDHSAPAPGQGNVRKPLEGTSLEFEIQVGL
ncbi:hypothetical protein DICSQDRAFT_148808 [Dichomitus squalens LYAD-421 SS1]|uniref:CxC2-like cysteine cluster KDZ transposase-associated domain-containing protein n=1 Tax=Dichomitus squalens (strain LYAD-421) TaxID=732165 RepID=R7SRR5_DICSQ|nr:uncharacterized protein DICSQDRAFT_148808 [Dichomitus squalens LYAD-421 SS1]EJF58879.1 hypothetical protein DICSQDRAFT_148808 [Dichomitus squalens LYAD-421 SS1]